MIELDRLGSCGHSVLEDPILSDTQRKEQVITLAKEFGLDHINSGAGRIVFSDSAKNTVVKIPYSSGKSVGGITQNYQEYTFWTNTTQRECFFEVYLVSDTSNPMWLLMEQATYTTTDPEFNLSTAREQLATDLEVSESHEVLNADNIGYSAKDNRYKVLDYGSYLDGL